MTETRCGAIAAMISGIMLIPLQFEVYEIVKTILFNLCVGIPIAAPSNTEAHQERYALLAIFGRTESGLSLFVGVEAKVDEPFGEVVRDVYLKAKAKQITGKATNAPERIEGLLKQHFTRHDPSMFDIRYQLLYATAGTVAVDADISVLYVVVFETPLYSETTSAENFRDYVDFMERVGAEPLKLSSKEADGHKLSLRGKELICLHESFDLRS